MPTVDGIVSQLDTTALISAVLAPHQVSIDTLERTVKNYEGQKEAIAGIKSRLSTLSEAIGKMGSPEKFRAYKIDSSSEQFTVTAAAGATVGTYGIRVVSLAKAELSVSQGVDDKGAKTLAKGNLAVTVGGVAHNVTLDNSNNSLTGLAEELDELEGVSAYVVDTGQAVGRYQLIVQGEQQGAANAITFDTSGLAGGTVPAFTEKVTAKDAEVSIGGVSIFTTKDELEVIPGITLTLKKEGLTEDTVKVSEDHEAMRAKIKEVVDAYNAIVDFHATQSVYNPEAGLRGPLVGESSTRRVLEDLGSMFSNRFDVPGTPLQSLSMLGLSTGRDGKLTLDEEAFDEAMASDPVGVELFLTAEDSPLLQIATKIDDLYVDSDNGVLASREEGLDATIEDLQESIAKSEQRMETQAKILREQFSAMETILGRIQSTQGFLDSFFASSSSSDS